MRASAWLWGSSLVAGGLGIATALLNRDTIRARATDAALSSDPALSPDVVDAGVTATIGALLGMSGLLVVVGAVALVLTLRRTRGVRWVLAVAGVVTVLLSPLVVSLVAGGSPVDDFAFVVQAALVVGALVALFLQPSRRWLREQRA